MNILFVGDFRYNSGSSHAVFNYFRVAEDYGCQIKISSEYGSLDSFIGHYIPICADIRWADHVVFVFESNPYLNEAAIRAIKQIFPCQHITIIDPDGRYSPSVHANGDSNHAGYSSTTWQTLYKELSDRILQPCLAPLPLGTQFFPYFGMEPIVQKQSNVHKEYTIQYVGNNWYRWKKVKDFLMQLQAARNHLGRIALKGKWWDGQTKLGLEAQTHAEVNFLKGLDVEVGPSVPFGAVVSTMSQALISPIFVRAMLSAQKHITPRMFESLCAETVPIFGKDDDYMIRLYGTEASMLCFGENSLQKVLDIVQDPVPYFTLVDTLHERMYSLYNYHTLFSTFLNLIC